MAESLPGHGRAGRTRAVSSVTDKRRQIGGAERRSLNVEGSYRHVLTDLYAFIGTALAAVLILSAAGRRQPG